MKSWIAILLCLIAISTEDKPKQRQTQQNPYGKPVGPYSGMATKQKKYKKGRINIIGSTIVHIASEKGKDADGSRVNAVKAPGYGAVGTVRPEKVQNVLPEGLNFDPKSLASILQEESDEYDDDEDDEDHDSRTMMPLRPVSYGYGYQPVASPFGLPGFAYPYRWRPYPYRYPQYPYRYPYRYQRYPYFYTPRWY